MLSLFFLSTICFFLILFALRLLLVKTAKPLLNAILFIWVIVRLHQVLCVLLVETGYIIHIPFILRFAFPLYYVAPACVFLYINALVNNRSKLSPIEYLHFIPAILAMIEIYPWFFSPSINTNLLVAELVKTKNMAIITDTGYLSASFHHWFRYSLLLIYLSLSWRILFRSKLMGIKEGDQSKKILMIAGLTAITLSHFNLFISEYSQNGILFINQYPLAAQFSSWFGIAVWVCFLYFLIMMDLARASSIGIHKCSRLIKTAYGIGALDWFNKIRIDYFIQTYPAKCNIKTIEAIALESGFSSRSTFYRAFKKEKGMMPSEFFKT